MKEMGGWLQYPGDFYRTNLELFCCFQQFFLTKNYKTSGELLTSGVANDVLQSKQM
jgi:hypothetical protein